MSRLVKAVMEVDTGKRMPADVLFGSIFNKEEECKSIAPMFAIYRISASFGAQAALSGSPLELKQAIADTKRTLVEAVFGEFRGPLQELEIALYERDIEKAHTIVRQLKQQMFEPE